MKFKLIMLLVLATILSTIYVLTQDDAGSKPQTPSAQSDGLNIN